MTSRDTSADTTLDNANMNEDEFLIQVEKARESGKQDRQPEIDALKAQVEDYKQYVDGVSDQLREANKAVNALKAENERLRSQLEHRELSVEEKVAQAKENNPDLVHWESNDEKAWDEAMKQDEILRTTSTWANKPFAARFAEVVRRVRAILPEASTPP